MTSLRASVVVTGTELVRGHRPDRNGPFLAEQLHRLGLEPARITIVGDRAEELEAALTEGLKSDLLVLSGGLGPTHDDRTVELVAHAAGRRLVVDASLAAEIESVSRRIAAGFGRPYSEFAPGVRKQASLPDGAVSLGLAGTAPGLVLEAGNCVVVVLPGPPAELRRLWAVALEVDAVRRVLARTRQPDHRILRFFGVSESAVAQALDAAGGDGDGVEATVCARDFEVHVDLVGRGDQLADALRGQLGQFLFAEDERPIAEIVLDLCRNRGLTLASAESCTGGLIAERLTAIPGASDVFVGAVVSYSNRVKIDELRVPSDLIAAHGAVSAEVARAMAAGARERLGGDVAVAVTGVAGPGGGTPEKPVGTVFVEVLAPSSRAGVRLALRGDRDGIRRRAAVSALHQIRQLLDTDT